MGSWGPGNLDNDGAVDFIGGVCGELVDSIWRRAQKKESREYDEPDYDELFAEFEMVFAFESADLFNGWNVPSPETFGAIKKPFLDDWCKYSESKGGPGGVGCERYNVISATLDRFHKLCEKYYAE